MNDGLDNDATKPRYLQHHTAIPAITFESSDAASGQAYFTVMTDVGVDHWGRYRTPYRGVNGRWRFPPAGARRRHHPRRLG
ncbi:MAG: hypothetical protein CM1200mP26_10100 [Acidimicrobiales bacterium]|nr:MAG: hypothetical protein CM1200mP26_10100 [Acidimicrobiales bacterium]